MPGEHATAKTIDDTRKKGRRLNGQPPSRFTTRPEEDADESDGARCGNGGRHGGSDATAGRRATRARWSGAPPNPQDEMIKALICRLDLEKYKATVKGLTQFGDRRQGTERNRKALDWIEAQLKSYGCPTERLNYVHDPPPADPGAAAAAVGGRCGPAADAAGQRRPIRSSPAAKCAAARADRAIAARTRRTGVNNDAERAAGREAARAQSRADDERPARERLLHQGRHDAARRDVHRRRPHGRPRVGRSGQRQRLRHGAGDGAGAHLQHAGRADRAHDPLRALEQRRDRPQRRARLRRAARGAPGQRGSAGIGPLSRAASGWR